MKKKLKKLIKNPNKFMLDFFYKRVHGIPACSTLTNTPQFSSSEKENNGFALGKSCLERKIVALDLKNDCLSSVDAFVDNLIEYLCVNTCLIIYANKDHLGNHCIFCNAEQMARIHDLILKYSFNQVELISDVEILEKGRRNQSQYYFYNKDKLFLSSKVIVDPWFKNSNQIFSYNKNNYVNRVDVRYLNKTPYSSHPLVLQGEYQKPDVEKIMGIDENIFTNIRFPVDVVLTWVDGQDINWKEKKNKYINFDAANTEDISSSRFDQIDEIRYALRSIKYFLKFVRNIYLVTDGQRPWWLDDNSTNIIIVDHKDFIDQRHLPTFNSHVIESYLHKIPGLSEHFIYMNDDCFIWKPMAKCDFFSAGGISYSRFEDVQNVFGKSSSLLPGWRNGAMNANLLLHSIGAPWAPSYHQHVPYSLKKSVLEKMESEFSRVYEEFRENRFRASNDVSTVSFLYHYYAIFKGEAVPFAAKSMTVSSGNAKSLDNLSLKSSFFDFSLDFVCINDGGESRCKDKVLKILETKFSQPVDWEVME